MQEVRSRVLVIESRAAIAKRLAFHLQADPAVASVRVFVSSSCRPIAADPNLAAILQDGWFDSVVFSPHCRRGKAVGPDLKAAEVVLQNLVGLGLQKVVVLSSAAVYGPNPHNPGLISEERLSQRNRRNEVASRWLSLEQLAQKYLGQSAKVTLTILRPAAIPRGDDPTPLGALWRRSVVLRVLGHDPSVQLLSLHDLARAVCHAVVNPAGGIFNVAPDGVIPLRQALRLAGVSTFPVPCLVQKTARALLSWFGLTGPTDEVDYLRYNWTICGEKIKRELGFVPHTTSADAAAQTEASTEKDRARWVQTCRRSYDAFGLDEAYFASCERGLAGFFQRSYWRLEARGLDHIPREGAAILVGVHRGFMPWDGVMAAHLVAQQAGRIPRFLIHPGLVKFPFLHDYMTKQGGIIACHENADYVLERAGLLAIFPEGIQGAFKLYRDAYRLDKLRNEFVKMALRNKAPIIPFVTLGSAEIFPILAKIEWPWWKRYAEWPFIPITPTFPLLPVPLPTKWHMQFLPPLHVEQQYSPKAACEDRVVQEIADEVRQRMADALGQMRKRRRSLFYGSIFTVEPGHPAGVSGRGERTTANGALVLHDG
jgi:1-acyl-sn-glycerol-3-phosphate acyltransferase/nucleoside-diphosphate-sugar epimerase